jgi:predicted enzyme related to lactoylglutathione lyase
MGQSEHDRRIDYLEFNVPDVAAARRFYSSVFGWTFTDYGPDYAGIRHPTEAGAEVGGFNGAGAEGRGNGPLVQLYSDDLEASVKAVTDAGGTVTEGPFGFPGGRRFHFSDLAGNVLGVWSEGE